MIFVFDLEGPLSPMDHAAEAMRVIGKKLGKTDFFDFFQMLSLYDDELTVEGKEDYNPGDTLRLIAPIVANELSKGELKGISETATLTPGAKDLIESLDTENVYVASTSYQQHALTVARKLGIEDSHVNCTLLPEYEKFPYFEALMGIFEDYKKSDINSVKDSLDRLFWQDMDPDYLKTEVCGGQRKLDVAKRISKERDAPLSEFMVVGDSITDINMLEGVKDAGGIAVSFNGNEYSAPKANVAVSSLSLMAVRAIADAGEDVERFIEDWNGSNDKYGILKPLTRDYFRQKSMRPRYDWIEDSKLDEVITEQKKMRVAIRKEYGELT